VVFTGDTGPSQSVEELAKNADMLVSEVLVIDDFVEALKKNGTWDATSIERQVGRVRHLSEDHLTPAEVGKLASRAEVKRVVLTHLRGQASLCRRGEEVLFRPSRSRQRPQEVLAKNI